MTKRIASHSSQIPAAVSRAYPNLDQHPTIVEVFYPDGRGWLTLRGRDLDTDRMVAGSYHKRITTSYARKLRRDGATAVNLDLGNGRTADFTTTELVQFASHSADHE
jgi:hypothetical protein